MRARGLDARGVAVGSLTAEGPSLTGEARIAKGGAVREAVQKLSEEVEKEPLPLEHREQVERFQQLLLEGSDAGGEVSPNPK